MFPISSTALTAPQIQQVTPAGETARVNGATVNAVGSALDAPAPASVTIDLSPVASFMMTVSQSRQQLTQLQAAIANGADPQEAANRTATLNETTQNVVNAFNLLPGVDFNQPQPQSALLLNQLVQGLTQQAAAGTPTQQQNLARIGLTLQPPPLSDATGGLSLDKEILRAAFNTDDQRTTSTLQNTLDTFSQLATRFAERLSGADRLAAPRAPLEQPSTSLNPETPSPIVNPPQASTAEVIAAQNAAEQANAAQTAAVQAAARAPTDPLRVNPALAAAIAAYNISDPAILSANARAAQAAVGGSPRVAAVAAAARARGIGNTP